MQMCSFNAGRLNQNPCRPSPSVTVGGDFCDSGGTLERVAVGSETVSTSRREFTDK